MLNNLRSDKSTSDIDMTELYDMKSIHVEGLKESMRESIKKTATRPTGDFDILMATFFQEEAGIVKRTSGKFDSRTDSALSGLIEDKIQTQTLPLALRKRLMYQRSIQDKSA